MTKLPEVLASLVQERVERSGEAGAGETRLIFHGPPLEILSEVFEILARKAGEAAAPVLLVVPELRLGEENPAVGASGRCTETHLLNLRNSPARPAYVALVPPGAHSNLSVSSTSDEFGLASANNAGNVAFEAWWSDEFVQDLLGRAVSAAGVHAQAEDARQLAENAASAADDVDLDGDRATRGGAWRVLARLFSATEELGEHSAASRWSLACGAPPPGNDKLAAREQLATLSRVADLVGDGFRPGIAKAKASASAEDSGHLDELLEHLRRACESVTGFERAPAAYYAPARGLLLAPPPAWWSALTVEKWAELLSDEVALTGDIRMICDRVLLPPAKGAPAVVRDEVELRFELVGEGDREVQVTLERTPAAPSGKVLAILDLDGDPFVDESAPVHRTPMRYVASAPGFKPTVLRVISMATWAPGVFVTCRLATKHSPPRAGKGRKAATWEAGLTLPGAGRYELVVLTSPGVEVEETATGISDEASQRNEEPAALAVRRAREGEQQLEIEAEGNYQVDLAITRSAADGTSSSEVVRVFVTIDEVQQHGCRSEFERLIRLNRRPVQGAEARTVVQLNRNARCSSLQDWMLSPAACERSFLPIAMAEDYVQAWVQPDWSGEYGPLLSLGRFLQDPRPRCADFKPPAGFIAARLAIAERIRRTPDNPGLVESAELGRWTRDDAAFRALVETYLSAYQAWLSSDPDVACWADVIAVTSLGADQKTLASVPDAILLNPLHPLRLAWHCLAQEVLLEADEQGFPCPAASVLDPDCVPDLLTLGLRAPDGVERLQFLSVENGTDYWSVLWNSRQLKALPDRSRKAPFGPAFGITVGGISAGFSAAQVGRALADVSDLLGAKPLVSVAVTSAGGATDACNEGLIEWCGSRFRQEDSKAPRDAAGPRVLEVYDEREPGARPDDATIANLSEDTGNSVRWFLRQPNESTPDLGIIAQLDMAEPGIAATSLRSPIGTGALLRHRVRKQLPNAFLSESRQALPPPPSGDVLSDRVAACVAALENSGERRVGMNFAPNVNAIRNMLEDRRADFVALSSSAIDPACFLGGWLDRAYLWDYDLPSYSHRAGDTSGYYLLSNVRQADREALGRALSRLPGCESLGDERVQETLLEVARRGIPTIRGLAGDDSGATGDLGLFLAVRLLQDRFRLGEQQDSLLPVLAGTADDAQVCIVVPVDPFRGYLSDLARGLKGAGKDLGSSRPDLLVIAARLAGERVQLRLTPVEVKCRPNSVFPQGEVADALAQARSLSILLSAMQREGQPVAWRLALQHLLLSIIGFGMRVYSQHPDVVDPAAWSQIHERLAAAILSDECDLSIDPQGRLIIVDDSPSSRVRDNDGDGFEETITINLGDASVIVGGEPSAFYDSVRARVGEWGLLPAGDAGKGTRAPSDEPASAEPRGSAPAAPVPEPGLMAASPLGAGDARDAGGPSDEEPRSPEPRAGVSDGAQPVGIILDAGDTVDGFQPRQVTLNISDTRLNHMNMGVVGDLGTGKTQLLKSLILQVSRSEAGNRGIKPRFLIFDYKRDYSSEDFVAATGARVVRPHNLPLNLFDTSGMEETSAPWLQRFRFFADVLDKIYPGIGAVQRDRLKKSVKAAYDSALPGRPPTLNDVHAAYEELMEGKADTPLSIMGDLIDMEVFCSDASAAQPFDEFLQGVVVISLDLLGQDDRSKNMLVAVMLNLFYENMLRVPKRPFIGSDPQLRAIDSYLLVDEADNIMQYEFDVLRKLLLQGREFGAGIVLASQYLRHFKVNATDYREPLLTWFVHKVPNVTPAELSALGLTGSLSELAERVKSLKNHQCLYKSFDVPGEVIRGRPFFELVQGKPGK